MLEKLESLKKRFELVSEKISDPEVIADQPSWRDYCREHSELSPIIDEYNKYKALLDTIEDDKALLESEDDKELVEMLREEISEAQSSAEECKEQLKLLLLPKDPNDDKNVIMEIRGG
ncbi:MAG: PCRF domain-containing protein, partial [Candidatus Ornithomonoglobus sp.]